MVEGYRDINALRTYILSKGLYFRGISYIKEYIVKNSVQCSEKRGISFKREPTKQIITYYPKQRNIMDLTETPIN